MKNFHTVFFLKNHGFRKTLLIVRLSLILSVAFGSLNIATASAQSPQNKTYTLKCKDQTVESIFEQLEKLSGYNFLYQSSDIKNLKKVTYDFVKASLNDIVTYCLKESGLAFEIVNKQVVIFPASQGKKVRVAITVTGKVTNSKGEPLTGANILIKGTLKGTTADTEGNYKIEVPENSTLVFSFLGHKNKETFVRSQTVINTILEEESLDLVEVAFISTGYQKIRPEQSTGSLSVIRAREFDTRVNTTDFLTGLQNKIPGLLINEDIDFEGNSLFQIRGISTINGNRNPLIVMDGYPTELSLDMINPNEIESVTVLKDAAAATVYGARS
ncbi:MAG: carboxypeptidase-like regulatory domain-containing protein, partial [Bacteroidales bacterium]|nr:carboxypeptidase-like regulatory domain-containing protein [Bacteroidales bacterium]